MSFNSSIDKMFLQYFQRLIVHKFSLSCTLFGTSNLSFVGKALVKRCTQYSLKISQLVQHVGIIKMFGCGRMTEHFPRNVTSVIGCTQLLGWFRLKYACGNWQCSSGMAKRLDIFPLIPSSKRNSILSAEPFRLLSKSTELLST